MCVTGNDIYDHPLILQPALPQDYGDNSEARQSLFHTAISGLVALDLLPPKFLARGRKLGAATSFMPMPEAAVDKDGQLVLGQIEVGSSGDIAPMQPEPKSCSVQRAPHAQFRTGVTAPNPAHVVAARGRAQMIDHVHNSKLVRGMWANRHVYLSGAGSHNLITQIAP